MPSDSEPISAADFLSKDEWRDLVRDIHGRQVVPIIGPALVTVADPATGQRIPITKYLAPKLAEALKLPEPERFATLNEAACAHLMRGGARKQIYNEVRELTDGLQEVEPPPALLELAGITDFDLFITSSFDPLLGRALERTRPGFTRDRGVLAYHPNRAVDLPKPAPSSLVYHLLGDASTYPDFAVCEEDYMEFLCGLIEQARTEALQNLAPRLKNSHLLLLGSPFSDWVVRFFLRMARQRRLSEPRDDAMEYLADRSENLAEPMVFFFDKIVNATRVVMGDPAEFVSELAARWRSRYGPAGTDDDFLARVPEDMPRGSVFISYAKEDLPSVCRLTRGLADAQVPVWLDKQRLAVGENFERSLEQAVKDGCSFFLSVISKTTESDPSRYVHKERAWAASRHVDGFVFYLPVVIDETISSSYQPVLEPQCFTRNFTHFVHMPGGAVTPAFASRIRKLVEEFRISGRPRG